MALDLTAITDELGAYLQTRRADVLSKFYNLDPTRSIFSVKSGIQDEFVQTEADVEELIQPYQKGWTPKGDVVFKPEIIKARPIKVDYTMNVKDLEATWLGVLKTTGSSSDDMPFAQFIIEHLMKRINRDLYKSSVIGVYDAPTPGTAGAAVDAMDGIVQVTNAAITATKITATATGAISASNIVTKVEQMIDAIGDDFRNGDNVLLMDPTSVMWYFRKLRADFGANINYVAGAAKIDFTNTTVIPVQHMPAGGMIITPKSNLIMVEDGVNEEEKFEIQKNRRELEILADFKRGVGYGIIEGLVWANDQL